MLLASSGCHFILCLACSIRSDAGGRTNDPTPCRAAPAEKEPLLSKTRDLRTYIDGGPNLTGSVRDDCSGRVCTGMGVHGWPLCLRRPGSRLTIVLQLIGGRLCFLFPIAYILEAGGACSYRVLCSCVHEVLLAQGGALNRCRLLLSNRARACPPQNFAPVGRPVMLRLLGCLVSSIVSPMASPRRPSSVWSVCGAQRPR